MRHYIQSFLSTIFDIIVYLPNCL